MSGLPPVVAVGGASLRNNYLHHIIISRILQYQFSISSLSWAIVGERDDGLEPFVRIGNSSTVLLEMVGDGIFGLFLVGADSKGLSR